MWWSRRILGFVFVVVAVVDAVRVRHHQSAGKQGAKFAKSGSALLGMGISYQGIRSTSSNGNFGLWPSVFNVATKALIEANATCGEGGREEFCRMSEAGGKGRCGYCDNFSPDPGKHHPALYALDGSGKWWQSPALFYGKEYEHVTITVDLKQVYQVAYVIIKMANSPRPGAWILERSLNGEDFSAWQYFATSEKDCLDRYGIQSKKGKHFSTDTEVICTHLYSRLTPMENGEIHTSLIKGRPGANETSPELLEFTKARYVRIRLQGLRGNVDPLPRWLSQDPARDKRLFYAIRDINIGGQCVCNGHAANCRHNVASGHPECDCAHHTCGPNCDRCCPLHNQRRWAPGTSRNARTCSLCNCHGHATSCIFDESVEEARLSLDIHGNYIGGGVCQNCTAHTAGINCEKCQEGYYRPSGVRADAESPCLRCDCELSGSSGSCDSEGKCACKPGYAGSRCDSCASGYKGYPVCEVCPCDTKGVRSMADCDRECICKDKVEGKHCERCKSGHFALQSTNHEGCLSCFCSGVTTLCESAILKPLKLETLNEWLIADLSVSETVKPTWDEERRMLAIGNYEIPGIESYFWLAPNIYTGNKLDLYGSELVFTVHWVVMRGDTSGKPTQGPNAVLTGKNGMQIAYGDDLFAETTERTFRIVLKEENWYHVPGGVKDIVTRLRRNEYRGEGVTRSQFLAILTDVKHVLLRAKFHTDQIEGLLERAVLERTVSSGDLYAGVVEKCSCPSGYTGLSCESCDYGHVRIVANGTDFGEGFCVQCDCNGHSPTCNPDTGQCFCEHNTVGEKCERCLPGFYGNPLLGSEEDCKPCACPLIDEENNFSPSCQLDALGGQEPGYVCTQCPKGYTGDHCEICDDGFFGVPTQKGGSCQLCDCGGGPCNRTTGQCLGCRGNTEGWRCERCKAQFFGDPSSLGCEACLCDILGSGSQACDNATGQCACKERFTGRTCDKCQSGYGNVTALCTPCSCNPVGSKSDVCDPHSGLCDCQPGVEGFHCDACQHLHYGFSPEGCLSCNCNPNGSEILTCDITTGQCRCKPHYVGRTCDNCETGYWSSPAGCRRCECDPDGSVSSNCHDQSGRCRCKEGVGGDRCDDCLRGYYGFSAAGCKVCEPCNKHGHVCHPLTGKCECPPYSLGEECQHCTANTWGRELYKGCKLCNCSTSGSARQQCDLASGVCKCLPGYTGSRCDRCEHGYYGYPRCKRCSCNVAGVDKDLGRCTKSGLCQCDVLGNCPCKVNVQGRKCDTCLDGTFGLLGENPEGCTTCFCFGRSTKCSEAGLTWGQIRTHSDRVLTPIFSSNVSPNIPPKKIKEIPGTHGNVTMELQHLDSPLYWKLGPSFSGDRILSYGGYIRFTASTVNPTQTYPQFTNFPLIILQGNDFELHYYPLVPILSTNNHHEVRLHESLWRDANSAHFHASVNRQLLMIVLQNVRNVYVKAGDFGQFERLSLQDVSLDTGIELPGHPPPIAAGVEICKCPFQYNSSSCQNPSVGFYRHYTPRHSVNGTIIIDAYVGSAKKCDCNGRSQVCDIETGQCLNCRDNTDGDSCEKCSEGYYGDPMTPGGRCDPCPCPSSAQNFAKSCRPPTRGQQFTCLCKAGYEGQKCDQCAPGHYGHPKKSGGRCWPCDCNPEGSTDRECDSATGQCRCKPGIAGKHCSQCLKPRHILQNNTCSPCDNCTQWLLNDIEALSNLLNKNTLHLQNGSLQPPWNMLSKMNQKRQKFNNDLNNYLNSLSAAKKIVEDVDMDEYEERLGAIKNHYKHQETALNTTTTNSSEISNKLESLLDDVHVINEKLMDLMAKFDNFGQSNITTVEAVKNGLKALGDIKKFANLIDERRVKDVLAKCARISDEAMQTFNRTMIDTKDAKDKLRDINFKLNDLENLTNRIKFNITSAKARNKLNTLLLEKLRRDVENVNGKYERVNGELKAVESVFEATVKNLNKVEKLHDVYRDLDVEGLLKEMRDKQDDFDENLSTLEEQVTKAAEHSDGLKKKADEYKSLFNLSDKEIKAINATESYTDIVKLINDSKRIVQTARERLDFLLKIPEGSDNVSVNANILYGSSTRLQNRINNLLTLLAGLEKATRNVEKDITDAVDFNWNNGVENRRQSKRIQEMKNRLSQVYVENLENDIHKFEKVSNDMKDVYKAAIDINRLKEIELEKKFRKLVNMTSNFDQFDEEISFARQTLDNIFNRNLTAMQNVTNNQFKYRNSEIADKLAKLRAEIAMSKHLVDEIRVSLSGLNCTRSYIVKNLEPSLITKFAISLNYKSRSELNGESSLIYLGNSSQYLNLKVLGGNLVFLIKLKDNVHQLKHRLNTGEFYTFKVERVAGTLQLFVNNHLKQSLALVGDKNEMFEANEFNRLYVGYAPNIRDKGIPGCIKDIVFNDYKVGLWNFYKTEGDCGGCTRPPDNIVSSCKRFNGDGYSYLLEKHQKDYNPTEISLQFSMRTFDEDALVFLAVHPQDQTFLSVALKNGRLQYEVHYKDEQPIVLTTRDKYNTGRKVRVTIAKKYSNRADIANMQVEMGEKRESDERTKNEVPRNSILKIKKCQFYFGGVPPNYASRITKSLHTHQSLLGEIDDVISHQAIALMDNRDESKGYYGIVETRCNEQFSFRKVSFDGNGHLELKPKPLKRNFKLSFILQTSANDSFVMLLHEDAATNAMLLRTKNGRIELILTPEDKTTLTSELIVSDKYYHIIELVKDGKSLTLKVDGSVQQTAEHSGEEMRNAKMLLGGRQGDGLPRFSGEIKDIFINNELLTFGEDTIAGFESCKIGRSGLSAFKVRDRLDEGTGKAENLDSMQMKEMPEREDCGKSVSVLEANAAKFGDAPNSHVVYILQDSFWKKDFSLQFDFRTFHSDGTLLFSKGVKDHHNLLQLQNGKLHLEISGKRKKKLLLDTPLNDGTWHNVLVEQQTNKKKRKIAIQLDGNASTRKQVKIPQNKIGREMFIGGLPEVIKASAAEAPFRGCIRSFKINNVMQGLVNDKNVKHHNIGQCFPNVEKGAYFGGDSYAIQSNYFRVSGTLELNFEFRTMEKNGILLSVSSPANNPAFSIELQNGAVVMSIDMGNGNISNVTNYIQDFVLCNKWHKVIAIISTELTVNVDGVSKSWVLSDSVGDLEAPLHIGGIPDYAPSGTLQLKENFKGCLRNLKINDNLADWDEMEKLNNVAINSCPVVQSV